MADKTPIEWTDATWNPIVGCSVVSPGCTNCYAMRLAGTRMKTHPSRAGLTQDSKAGAVWTGEVRLMEQWLGQPLQWAKPRMIFVCAHADLFHESVPDEWIDRVFAVMALAPQHTFQVLTKRPKRMRDYLGTRAGDWSVVWPDANPPGSLPISRHEQRLAMRGAGWPDAIIRPTFPLPNVWLGVSVEDQRRADERVPILLDTPAAVRWISAEPLLGPLDLRPWLSDDDGCVSCDDGEGYALPRCHGRGLPVDERCPTMLAVFQTDEGPIDALGTPEWITPRRIVLDWVVAGGESGPGARPMHPDWARSLRDQCATVGVPFVFKQWGEWVSMLDRDRDDLDWRADYPKHESVGHRVLNLAGGCGFHGKRVHIMRRVGKKVAGRLLDGVLHDAYPVGTHA